MTATTVSSPGILYQMHLHRVLLAVHGVFARGMEMELL
jgi:hypothetical protein